MKRLILLASLLSLNAIAGTPFTATLEKKAIVTTSRAQEDHYILSVNLGRLSRSAFQTLLNETAPTNPAIKRPRYNSRKNYSVEEFLPPLVQATLNRVMISKADKIPVRKALAEENGVRLEDDGASVIVGSYSNCWGTSWEFLRTTFGRADPLRFQTFWIGRMEAEDAFSNPKISSTVAADQAAFGDVMLLRLNSKFASYPTFVHTAIVIGTFGGKRIVFEKIDSQSDNQYRLALEEDVLAKYRAAAAEQEEGTLLVEYRSVRGATQELPDPATFVMALREPALSKVFVDQRLANVVISACGDGFGGGCSQEWNFLQTQKIVQGANGLHILDPNRKNSVRFPLATLKP